jgi:GNAT superfamily N-acetyltransferase
MRRATLADRTGRPVATYEEAGMRGGRPWADFLEPKPGVGRDDVVAAVLGGLACWAVSASPDLGAALVARGATPARHSHVLSLDLLAPPRPAPPAPAGVVIEPFERVEADLVRANEAAYPPGHPDHRPAGSLEDLVHLAAGAVVGPLLACSRVARRDGRAIGAAMVTRDDRPGPVGGPWLAELFRDPRDPGPGTGAALLGAAIAAARADGLERLGLAVTDGNRARGLYAAAGFELVISTVTVTLPG